MDKSLQARIKMQDEGKTALRNSGYRGAAVITVGGGKTKMMIDLAHELIQKFNIQSVLYLCDNKRLRDSSEDGFPQQLEQWGSARLKEIIRLECYQTACRWENKEFDLVLADEFDFAMTPVYRKSLFSNKYKYIIALSGTITTLKKKMITSIVPIVFVCDTLDAERRGIINKTKYHIYNYPMTDEESKQYLEFNSKIAMKMAEENMDAAKYWVMRRKEFLYTLDSSHRHCRKLMRWVWETDKSSRLVIFSQRTEQADRLCTWSFHGKNEKDNNLSKFQKGVISAIAVVSKIKRGINLKSANKAIFEMVDGSTTEFEQRGGRMKRLAVSEVADVIFMCPWVKKFRDGKPYYQATIVNEWIHKCTGNLTNIEFVDLKI